MSNSELILTILIISIGTFIFRFSFIYLYGRVNLPEWLRRAMHFVPPAVLSALIFPAIILKENIIWISPQNPRLVAGLIAMIVAWRTKSSILPIVIGLGVFWLMLFI